METWRSAAVPPARTARRCRAFPYLGADPWPATTGRPSGSVTVTVTVNVDVRKKGTAR